jgi:type I restriction enzyme S subunit
VVVPTDWKFVELGAVVTTGQLGGNYPNSSVSDGLPLIKMGNLGRGKIDLSTRYFLARGFSPSSLDMLKPNDVLFNTRNTLDLVGKVAIWRNELPVACFNSNIMRLSFDSSVVCNEYANYALNTSVSIKALREMATGTTSVAAIYGRDLWLLPFLLPPLKEQKAIAEALSDADAAIESLDALIAKKLDVKQAMMQQLLTGRTRLPGFNADWKEVRLGDLGSTFGGLTGKSSKDFGDGNSSFVTFMNVMSNVVLNNQGTEKVRIGNGERQSQLLEGDVIFNGSSETPEEVGFGSAVPIELSGLYLNSFCFGFRRKDTKSLDPKFFAYLTRSPLGRDIIRPMAQGSTRYNIAKTNLLNGRFPLPPLKEQEAIAEALTVMDDELEALNEQVLKLRMVKEGMMQDLLTGKVRLV